MKKTFLADLNEDQLLAATTTEGPVLILAGAGSGKTKTIISRTVNIIYTNKIDPRNILIMTFTNKAAREMRERGEKMLESFEDWDGFMPEFTTFHSWGVKFIRSLDNNMLASKKLNQYFNISDESDQVVILNKILQSLISEDEMKKIKIKNLLLPIGFIQNNLVKYDSIENATKGISLLLEEDSSWIDEVMTLDKYDINSILSELYFQYKKELRANNLIDFEDLINIPIEVISENSEIKNRLRNYYKYIMVDEFQDTNGSQLELLNLLTSEDENICVVGDDSQSIYGWRGANIDYILNFHKARKNVRKINLKINYRSTEEIVSTANKLLTHATQKHEFKEALEAFTRSKGIIESRFFKSAKEEANRIVSTIKNRVNYGIKYGDFAILYRAAYINRNVELELIQNKIPYKIHRGKSLLERKSAADIISYLKFLSNTTNSIALAKVLISSKITTDKRVSQMQFEADRLEVSLSEYLKKSEFDIKGFGQNLKDSLSSFGREISYFESKLDNFSEFKIEFFARNCISRVYKKVINDKLRGGDINDQNYESALSALGIIDIVQTLVEKYSSLDSFLDVTSLEGEEDNHDENKVNLMTVHASKGLEFENVFVVGMTQGVFPGDRCFLNGTIEEERRLAYVALTRAKNGLFVSGAPGYFGETEGKLKGPSQFLFEAGLL